MFLHMNQYLSCKILQKNGLKSNEFFGLISDKVMNVTTLKDKVSGPNREIKLGQVMLT